MQCCDKCVNVLAVFLAALIELCPLENHITVYYEVLIKFRFNGMVLLQLLSTQLEGFKNIVCLVSNSVDQRVYLTLFVFLR